MKINKDLICKIKPKKALQSDGIIGKSVEMNSRIGKKLKETERKIEVGRKNTENLII